MPRVGRAWLSVFRELATELAVIALASGATGLVVEVLWAASQENVPKGRFLFSWQQAFACAQLAFVFGLLWTIWGIVGLESRTKFTNALSWSWLLPSYSQSKPVATAWPMLLIVMYLAIEIEQFKHLDNWVGAFVRWLNNDAIHFTFLGVDFQAQKTFRFEFVGYVLALLGFIIVRMAAPHWSKVASLRRAEAKSNQVTQAKKIDGADMRNVLADTIVKDGSQIPARDLVLSLSYLRDKLALKHKEFDWPPPTEGLDRAKKKVEEDLDSEARQEAAEAIKYFPDDQDEIERMGHALFDTTRPKLRVGLAAALAVAYFLVGLPIVARGAGLLFPILKEGPGQW